MNKKRPADIFNYLAQGNTINPSRLVILLHGYGRDASVMEKQAQAILDEMPDALVIMPHAPELCEVPDNDDGNALAVPQVVREGNGGADEARQWFSIRGEQADLGRRMRAITASMNEFIDLLIDTYGLPDRQIALMGFSQGGSVALYTAYSRGQELGCVAGHSAPYWAYFTPSSSPPTLYVYGLNDEEFSTSLFEESAERIAGFVPDLIIEPVPGLSHRTSEQTRHTVAAYITARLA